MMLIRGGSILHLFQSCEPRWVREDSELGATDPRSLEGNGHHLGLLGLFYLSRKLMIILNLIDVFGCSPPGGYLCMVMILKGLPSTITKKLFILKELGAFLG